MKNLFYLFFVLPLLFSCGGGQQEFDFIEYRTKDESFSKEYGEPVYTIITFGNKLDKSAVSAILGDEEGWNVFGKLMGGIAGMNSIVDGKYTIEGNYVNIKWEQNNVMELPSKLKIENDNFEGKHLNKGVISLIDESNKVTYNQKKAWDAE